MEHGPFIDGLPINSMVDLSMAMLVITRWYIFPINKCYNHMILLLNNASLGEAWRQGSAW